MTTQARELAGIISNAGDLNFSDDITLGSDAAVLSFGADSDVTLTHVADTGLLVNSTRQLQFGDSGTYINQSADGVLNLTSDTEIELNATTLDINANVDISGTLTVAGALDFGDLDISNVGSIALDTITNDGADITLDSSGDIILDADGSDIVFKDDGTSFGKVQNSSTNMIIESLVSDKDILFYGNDGGASVLSLRLDMSEAGAATFNAGIIATGTITAASGKFATERGSASAPTFTFSDDTDTGMYNVSNADLGFTVGGTDRLHIKASGNVGIGTTSPSSVLSVKSDANNNVNNGILFEAADSTNKLLQLYENSTGECYMGFYQADTQTALIRTNGNSYFNGGNVGIGTASPNRPLEVYASGSDAAVMRIVNAGNHVSGIELHSGHGNWAIHNSDTVGDALEFRDDSAAVTRMIIKNDGNVGIGTTSPIRKLDIVGASGADSTLLLHMDADTADGECRLEFKADSTNDDRRIKGAIIFKRSDPGTRGTGSMHFCVNNVNSDANVSTSQTLLYLGEDGDVQIGNPATGAAGNDLIIMPTAKFYLDAGGDTYIDEYSANEFGITTGGSRKFALSGGNLYHTGSINSNHNFSDERLKENIVVIPNALEKIQTLRGITFTRKDDGSVGTGLIAQELEKVLPEAVYESKTIESLENPDAEEYKAIRYEKTVGLLVEGIKEQQTIIDDLKARITVLEG